MMMGWQSGRVINVGQKKAHRVRVGVVGWMRRLIGVRWFQFPVLRTFFVSLFFGFVNAWNPGLSNVFPFTFIKYLKSEFRFKRVPV